MEKEFKPRTKKVASVGDELRFQREYYCYKNNVSLPLKIISKDKDRDERETLQDILYNFMNKHFKDNSEYATSYDVLYAIENGKSKKKNDPYNANSYFLRMFCLFKIYGFLDSMTILELLKETYGLEPSFETSKNIIRNLESNYTLENLINNREKGKTIRINIKEHKVRCSKDTYLKFCSEKERVEINNLYDNNLKKQHYSIVYKDGLQMQKKEINNSEDLIMYAYDFLTEKKMLQDKMKKLSNIERYCISLELGRDTSYIDSFISNMLQNINIDTLLKTLEYFNMKAEKFYNILNIIKRDFSSESMFYSHLEVI